MKNAFLAFGCIVLSVSGYAADGFYVNVLGEDIPSRVDRPVQAIITNLVAETTNGFYVRAEWKFSSDTGMLTGVRKYSTVLRKGISGLEKRRLMSEVQHQMVPPEVGCSSVLKEKDDNTGEIETDDGLLAKISFVDLDEGIQMIVDISISEKYLANHEHNVPKGMNEVPNLEEFAHNFFKLSSVDLSTNNVGVCELNANGVRGGFRFVRPKIIRHTDFNTLMCYFDRDSRLHGFRLHKLISGKDCMSQCARFFDSLEVNIVKSICIRNNMTHRIEPDGRQVRSVTTKDGVRIEIEMRVTGGSFGVVCLNVNVDQQ